MIWKTENDPIFGEQIVCDIPGLNHARFKITKDTVEFNHYSPTFFYGNMGFPVQGTYRYDSIDKCKQACFYELKNIIKQLIESL